MSTKLTGEWPGIQLTDKETVNGQTWWVFTAKDIDDDEAINIQFSDGPGEDTPRTDNIWNLSSDSFFKYNGGGAYSQLKDIKIYLALADGETDSAVESKYHLYAWEQVSDTEANKLNGDWPGDTLKYKETDADGKTWWVFTAGMVEAVNIKFNEGNGLPQTDNILNITEDTYFIYNGGTSYKAVRDINVYLAFAQGETSASAESKYNLYAWSGDAKPAGAWPGSRLTEKVRDIDGNWWWVFSVSDVNDLNVIFSEGSGSPQTDGITGITKDIYLRYDGGTEVTKASTIPVSSVSTGSGEGGEGEGGDSGLVDTQLYVYFNNAEGWSKVYCYIYYPNSAPYEGWPGTEMAYDSESGLWKFAVPKGYETALVIFNNGLSGESAGQYPAANQPGLELDGESSMVLDKDDDGNWTWTKETEEGEGEGSGTGEGEGSATAIRTDQAEKTVDNRVFTLNGREVRESGLTRGIYIKAGKKFIVK